MAERFVWTSPDGVSIDLTDEAAGFSVLAGGTRGLRSVTYDLVSSSYAGVDGEKVDAIRAGANEITLGLLLQAGGVDEFRDRVRGLVRAMRPKRGPGTLTVTNETGSSRSLQCYCTAGLEGDEAVDATLAGAWWRVALKMFAPDPWWYGDTKTMSLGLGPATTFFPIFPLKLSPSVVQGRFTIDLSDTDTETAPVWTITGPGTSLVLTNETTGQVITVNAAIPAGQIMVVNTQPGQQSVRLGSGTNLMPYVASDPAFWTLADGVNVVTAALVGATSASRIVGAWVPRYAGI